MAKTATLSPANLRHNKGNSMFICDPDRESVIDTSLTIANYYIAYHLRDTCPQVSLHGLPKSYLIPAQPSEICSYVTKFCTQMEKERSSFFENIPNDVNLRQENAKVKFMRLSKEVCTDGINWGRIMSVYALAGVFAAHFVRKGQTQVVTNISSWISEVVEKHLADWIVKEGGWDALIKNYGDLQDIWQPFVAACMFAGAAGLLFYKLR